MPFGPHFSIYVAFDGEGLTAIATDSGFAASESDRRSGVVSLRVRWDSVDFALSRLV